MTNPFKEFFNGKNPEQVDEAVKGNNSSIHPADKRVTGRIIKVHESGWGFITSKEVPFSRIFFHWTSLMQGTKNFTELKNGMKVEFTPVKHDEKGWRAIKIKTIDSEPIPAEEPEVVTETKDSDIQR